MMRVAVALFVTFAIFCFVMEGRAQLNRQSPAKTETLSCVRVKEVTPAGTIKYYCEVKNGRP